MARKSKKQQEAEELLEEIHLLYKIFTDERYTRAFCQEIEQFGEVYRRCMLAVSGKENEHGASK